MRSSRFLSAGPLTVAVTLGLSGVPAVAKCVVPDPIFGMKTYVDDKYCQKKSRVKSHRSHKVMHRPTVRRQNVMRPTAGKADVRELQSLLAGLGYDPGPVDGVAGPTTRKAAKAFMSAVNLPADASTADTIAVLKRISGK